MPIKITNINKYIFYVKDNTLIVEDIKVNFEEERKNKENISIEIKKDI